MSGGGGGVIWLYIEATGSDVYLSGAVTTSRGVSNRRSPRYHVDEGVLDQRGEDEDQTDDHPGYENWKDMDRHGKVNREKQRNVIIT